jgi:hypothetical protein
MVCYVMKHRSWSGDNRFSSDPVITAALISTVLTSSVFTGRQAVISFTVPLPVKSYEMDNYLNCK